MKTAFSWLVLAVVIVLGGVSFAPEGTLKGPVLWASLGLLCAAGILVRWYDGRQDRGQDKHEQD